MPSYLMWTGLCFQTARHPLPTCQCTIKSTPKHTPCFREKAATFSWRQQVLRESIQEIGPWLLTTLSSVCLGLRKNLCSFSYIRVWEKHSSIKPCLITLICSFSNSCHQVFSCLGDITLLRKNSSFKKTGSLWCTMSWYRSWCCDAP